MEILEYSFKDDIDGWEFPNIKLRLQETGHIQSIKHFFEAFNGE